MAPKASPRDVSNPAGTPPVPPVTETQGQPSGIMASISSPTIQLPVTATQNEAVEVLFMANISTDGLSVIQGRSFAIWGTVCAQKEDYFLMADSTGLGIFEHRQKVLPQGLVNQGVSIHTNTGLTYTPGGGGMAVMFSIKADARAKRCNLQAVDPSPFFSQSVTTGEEGHQLHCWIEERRNSGVLPQVIVISSGGERFSITLAGSIPWANVYIREGAYYIVTNVKRSKGKSGLLYFQAVREKGSHFFTTDLTFTLPSPLPQRIDMPLSREITSLHDAFAPTADPETVWSFKNAIITERALTDPSKKNQETYQRIKFHLAGGGMESQLTIFSSSMNIPVNVRSFSALFVKRNIWGGNKNFQTCDMSEIIHGSCGSEGATASRRSLPAPVADEGEEL